MQVYALYICFKWLIIRHKKNSVKDIWSGNEFDFLWIGVRRHEREIGTKCFKTWAKIFSQFPSITDGMIARK